MDKEVALAALKVLDTIILNTIPDTSDDNIDVSNDTLKAPIEEETIVPKAADIEEFGNVLGRYKKRRRLQRRAANSEYLLPPP